MSDNAADLESLDDLLNNKGRLAGLCEILWKMNLSGILLAATRCASEAGIPDDIRDIPNAVDFLSRLQRCSFYLGVAAVFYAADSVSRDSLLNPAIPPDAAEGLSREGL